MGKYYQGQEYREKAPSPIAQGISAGLQSYNEQKKQQEIIRKAANFDNMSKVEQALFLAEHAGQPAAAAHIKTAGIAEASQNWLAKAREKAQGGQNIIPGNKQAPNVNQLQNAMNVTNQLQNPTPMNALAAGRTNQPGEVSPQEQGTTQIQKPVEDKDYLSGLSDEQLKKGIFEAPPLADKLEKELVRRQQDRKEANKKIVQDRKFMLDVDKKSDKYDDEIQKEAKHARQHLQSTAVARKAIESGKVNPKSMEGLARTLFKGSAWENYFKTPEVALLEAAALQDFVGMKDIFGVRLSDADLRQAAGKVISPDKSPEANLSIIDFREFQDRMKIAEGEIADEIKAENGGFKPIDFAVQVRKRMQDKYSDEAEQIVKKAANEGNPTPEPNQFDPLLVSSYGEIPQGMVRLKKGSEVIDIPISLMNDAVNDGYDLLEQGA